MLIDLHTHSTASDGTDSPVELIEAAAAAGVDVVALTDHDTTFGWADAARAVATRPVRLVRGMELSCVGRGEDGAPVPVHLLGYLFDPDHAGFAAERARLRDERVVRLRKMAANFVADGIALDADAILAGAGPSAGRPHLARALVDLGVVPSVAAAFDDLLATGGKYYEEKVDTPLDRGVELITEAGGVAVIAHARARTRGRLLATDHIVELARGGALGGLEVDHPDHCAQDRAFLRAIADQHGLVVTGSSDYHGSNKTVGLGVNGTAPEQFDALVRRASGVPVIG